MKNNQHAAPTAGEEKRALHSVLHGFLSMDREPAFFHGMGEVKGNMNLIFFLRIAGPDSNGRAGKESLQIFSHGTLGIIEKGDHSIYFCGREPDARLRSIHEKGMPARAFEIKAT